jgi:hypothetical protein
MSIIKDYAHDYRGMEMSQKELEIMLTDFLDSYCHNECKIKKNNYAEIVMETAEDTINEVLSLLWIHKDGYFPLREQFLKPNEIKKIREYLYKEILKVQNNNLK